jgi:hypothetical protein
MSNEKTAAVAAPGLVELFFFAISASLVVVYGASIGF